MLARCRRAHCARFGRWRSQKHRWWPSAGVSGGGRDLTLRADDPTSRGTTQPGPTTQPNPKSTILKLGPQQAGGGRARGIDDGVPAVGPDEGPGSKTRAEAAVWGHGEPRRERSAPYLTRSVGWTTCGQPNSPTQPVPTTQPNPKSTILLLGPQAALATFPASPENLGEWLP